MLFLFIFNLFQVCIYLIILFSNYLSPLLGTSSNCNRDEYDCGTGECIPVNRVCDGFVDCMGSADEQNCGE